MKILVVVDMQNDFIDGALGTAEASAIVGRVADKIRGFAGRILYTRDTHGAEYLQTQEGRLLPVEHCIHGTQGWQLNAQVAQLCDNEPIDKQTFGSIELGEELCRLNNEHMVESIEFIGVCTDICVISNALIAKAFLPETPIIVDGKCCAGVSAQSHETALRAMQACQIEII